MVRLRIALLSCCVMLLPACQRGEPHAPASSASPAPKPRAISVAAATCAPEPELSYSQYHWADSTGAFADDTPAYAELQSHFHQAYAQACDAGWFAHAPLLDPAAAHPGALMLANAPEANIAAIYLDARDDVPADAHDMLLEYPFVDSAKRARVPSVDEVREAIWCHAIGASGAEEESSGRCLPD
jgi:hypothetical protein